MEKYTKFGVLSKSNSKGGKNFEDFSQLTPAGKRLTLVKWDAPIFEWSSFIQPNFVTELLDQDIHKKHIVSLH